MDRESPRVKYLIKKSFKLKKNYSFDNPNILSNKFINDSQRKIEYEEVENKKLDESRISVSMR